MSGLKKELKLFDVYAIATGTTLSAGFFLLPGLAAIDAGPALVLAYVLAALPMIPATFSVVELATAMPRAGGVYYYIDRALGPLMGTIGGIGTWITLMLKVSFSLIGMGAYIRIFQPNVPMLPTAITFAVALGILNLFGVKKTGKFQVLLVIALLCCLAVFIGGGLPQIDSSHFDHFFDAGHNSIIATAGFVYISFVGVTNIASLAEEVHEPERNLPLGVFLALGTAITVYILGTSVMVGMIPLEVLKGDLTPVATAAGNALGEWGRMMVSAAALFAFISVANSGTMSASRYPLAMSRDQIFPAFFRRLSKAGTPINSILLTVLMIVLIMSFLDITKIAKLASAFQLLMFAIVCLAVIIMRESRIRSYDPGFKSPWYPWMQIFGIASSFFLIMEMGLLPQFFTFLLVLLGVLWYWKFCRQHVTRNGAMYHIFERLGSHRHEGLDQELRGILKDKGLREEDPFEQIVARALVLDFPEKVEFEPIVSQVSNWLSDQVDLSAGELESNFLDGTRLGRTPVTRNVALPHLHMEGIHGSYMALIRAKQGVAISLGKDEKNVEVHSIFFLVSAEENPTQHLRMLAQIARRVDDEIFKHAWSKARNVQDLKEAFLHDDHFLAISLQNGNATESMIGSALSQISIPEGCLMVLYRRGEKVSVPRGKTVFQEGDRVTIIGDPEGIRALQDKYVNTGPQNEPLLA